MHKLESERCIPIIAGSTTPTVTMYERGQTAHSAFRIPFNQVRLTALFPSLGKLLYHNHSENLSNIKFDFQYTLYFAVANFIIWEEMPMAHRSALECNNKVLKEITGKNYPVGSKIV
jgi:hypothetical protein